MTTHRKPRFADAPGVSERGSAAAQATVAVPLVLVMLLLIIAGGRLTSTAMDLSYAAHVGARAASLARTPAEATRDARNAVASTLDTRAVVCQNQSTTVDTTRFTPGGIVTVTLSCTVNLADVAALALPGTTTITRSASSPLDPWRGNALDKIPGPSIMDTPRVRLR